MPTAEEVKSLIPEYISNNNTQNALSLLQEYFNEFDSSSLDTIIILKSQINKLNKDHLISGIDNEEYLFRLNKIHNSILSITHSIPKQPVIHRPIIQRTLNTNLTKSIPIFIILGFIFFVIIFNKNVKKPNQKDSQIAIVNDTLIGNVYSGNSPISKAKVTIQEDTTLFDFTDISGMFKIIFHKEIGNKKWTVIANKIGYVTKATDYIIPNTNQDKTLKIVLDKVPTGPSIETKITKYIFPTYSKSISFSNNLVSSANKIKFHGVIVFSVDNSQQIITVTVYIKLDSNKTLEWSDTVLRGNKKIKSLESQNDKTVCYYFFNSAGDNDVTLLKGDSVLVKDFYVIQNNEFIDSDKELGSIIVNFGTNGEISFYGHLNENKMKKYIGYN